MFFQPIPAEVSLPPPRPERVSTAYRLTMRPSAWVFAAAAGYLGWELLWHGALLGLLSYRLPSRAALPLRRPTWNALPDRATPP